MLNDQVSRRRFAIVLAASGIAACSSTDVQQPTAAGFRPLFDGETLDGWEGDESLWIVEDGMLIGRSPGLDYNDFLATEESFSDFVLRFEIQLVDNVGNGGTQFRSQRIPNDNEMIGYQADVGETYWASLYDESRRRKTLARPDDGTLASALKMGEWNAYEVHANGTHIVLKLNGVTTVDYVEEDPDIPLEGRIAVQIHSGPAMEVRYRNIEIQEL